MNYTEPTINEDIGVVARGHLNEAFRSRLTNFSANTPPTSANFSAEGANFNVPDGVLYHNANTGAVYVSDSRNKKNSPIGGNWTGHKLRFYNESGWPALVANVVNGTYKIGDVVSTVSASSSLNSNAKTYLITSNSASVQAILEVGRNTLGAKSIVSDMIADSAVTTRVLGVNSINTSELASGAVQAANIDDDAVTSAKIQNDSISSNKISSGITGSKFTSIPAGKFTSNAVSTRTVRPSFGPNDTKILGADAGNNLVLFDANVTSTLNEETMSATSGSSKTFTVNSSANTFTVILNNISTSGGSSDDILIRVANSSAKTSGYNSVYREGVSNTQSNSAMVININSSSDVYSGILTISRGGVDTDWYANGIFYNQGGNNSNVGILLSSFSHHNLQKIVVRTTSGNFDNTHSSIRVLH